MNTKFIIEATCASIIGILIVFIDPNVKLNNFVIELLCEKPYIFILYAFTFVIALYSPLIAIFYGILIIVLDTNISFVVKEK